MGAVKAIVKGAVWVVEFRYDLPFNPDQASQKWVKAVSAVEDGAETASGAYSIAEFIMLKMCLVQRQALGCG